MPKDKKPQNQPSTKMGFNPAGLGIGAGIGVCFGTATGNMALGLCMGLGVGLCFCVALGHTQDTSDKPDGQSGEE